MGYGQATSVYAYLYIYHATSFLTNTVFLNTTSGLRKLPEYFIFASHDKFKMCYCRKNIFIEIVAFFSLIVCKMRITFCNLQLMVNGDMIPGCRSVQYGTYRVLSKRQQTRATSKSNKGNKQQQPARTTSRSSKKKHQATAARATRTNNKKEQQT